MPFRDPACVLIYGPSGAGKTVDELYSFPNAFFCAPPGALKPGKLVVGYEPPDWHVWDPPDVESITKFLPTVATTRCTRCPKPHAFTEAVVDDFSLYVDRQIVVLEQQRLSGGPLWQRLQSILLDFRDVGRRCRLHLTVSCHERGPKVVDGIGQRGGPKLPGKLPEAVPAAFDLVVRATYGGGAVPGAVGGRIGWPGMYRCSPSDTNFVSRDRHGVAPDPAPMNIAEVLRAAEYVIARAPGLEWMDEAVRVVATALLFDAGGHYRPPTDDHMVLQAALGLFHPSMNPLHVNWVLRDAVDRVVIARSRLNPHAMFGVAPVRPQLQPAVR